MINRTLRISAATLMLVLVTPLSADCPDTDGNSIINVDDLLEVVAGWGPCDPPCSGDLDGSGSVDVSDLLSVIKSWGPCETDEVLLVFAQDLEHRIPGPYDESMLDEDWNEPTWSQGVDDGRVSIVETDNGANMALAVLYPEGEYGTSATGAQWKLMFDESHDCVRLSYRLQFVDPFDFVRGGKLPGLIGGEGNTGGGHSRWYGRVECKNDVAKRRSHCPVCLPPGST